MTRARPAPAPPVAQAAQAAAAAARRLDDTFRGYLAERGAKPVPLAEVTALVAGVVGLRLAGDAVLQLWDSDAAEGGDRAAARRELLSGSDMVRGWYARFAESLVGRGSVPEPLTADAVANGRLVDAVGHDLRDRDGRATATAVRVILDRRPSRRRAPPAVDAGGTGAGGGGPARARLSALGALLAP